MQNKNKKQPAKAAVPPKPVISPSLFGIPFKTKCIILAVLSFLLYTNTIGNEYALDDGIVIIKNDYVQQGFKGIGKILSTDAYDSYYKQMNAGQMLAGGRYRPLSIVVFAMEQSFVADSAQLKDEMAQHKNPAHSMFVVSSATYWHIKHFINVLFYVACILSIFYFLSNFLFKKLSGGEDMAFIATALFAIHPLHTEVVANVKSLDEIISLLCIMGTFIFSLKYLETKVNKHLFLGMLLFLCSLLAKEYAVMLIFLLPLAFYLLTDKKPTEAIMSSIPYFVVFGIYMLMRIGSVGMPKNVPGGEILNNPYMLATHAQKMATEWYVLGKYLGMMFFPYPLASDYSYNTIPYQSFSSPAVLLTILLYVGMVVWGIKLTKEKNILAFAIFFYLLNLAMVSNFLVDIGATMGERLAFHSTLGFVIVITYGLFYLIRKMDFMTKRNAIGTVMALLLVLCTAECIPRNVEWKNDVSLFITDVKTVPNSTMVLGNAGARYIDLAEKSKDQKQSDMYVRQAMQCLIKSITLDKEYVTSYLNLGVAYYKINEPDSALLCWNQAKQLYPSHPTLKMYFPLLGPSYMYKGIAMGKVGNMVGAVQEMKKGLAFTPNNPDIWYNIGGVYFTIHQYDSARMAWNKTLQLKPDYKDALRGMSALPPAQQIK